jgi:hypothetical protein
MDVSTDQLNSNWLVLRFDASLTIYKFMAFEYDIIYLFRDAYTFDALLDSSTG